MDLRLRLQLAVMILGLALICQAPLHGAEGAKPEIQEAPPSAEKKSEVRKAINDLFKEEYARQDKNAKLALAKKLLAQGVQTNDDSAVRYVLFEEAWTLAIAARKMATAMEAAELLGRHFQVDRLSLKITAAERISRFATTKEEYEISANGYLALVGDALGLDKFLEAPELCNLASEYARKAQSMPLLAKAQALKVEVAAQSRRYNEIRAMLQRVAQNPDDPLANLQAGRYYCFVKKDWTKGLPFLGKGNDTSLKKIAEEELKMPTVTAEQSAIGDLWWEAATKEATLKEEFRERAEYWYHMALPGLASLDQLRLKKKLAERHIAKGPATAFLSDLEELEAQVGWGKFGKNGDMGFQGLKIQVNGKAYSHGLSTSPGSNSKACVKYGLKWAYRTLTGEIALNDSVPEKSSSKLIFSIAGDGVELWRSEPTDLPKKPQKFAVDVFGVDILELIVHCPGKFEYAHAVWLDPVLSK